MHQQLVSWLMAIDKNVYTITSLLSTAIDFEDRIVRMFYKLKNVCLATDVWVTVLMNICKISVGLFHFQIHREWLSFQYG